MATKVTEHLIDDMDGKDIKPGEGETVTFGLDGTNYEIDLSTRNAEKLRGFLLDYTQYGRKVRQERRTTARKVNTPDGPPASEIREWATANGHEVPARGRIPAEVREAFDQAHA